VYKRLSENVALNSLGNVTLMNAAVANQSGTLTLYQSPDDPEANNTFGEGDRCVEVVAVTLDEDLTAQGIETVQILKIDAEGGEPLVLRGAAKLMNSTMPPLILIELNSHCLYAAGSSPEAVLELLQRSGYRCVEMERWLYKGQPVADVLAIPPRLDVALGSISLETDKQKIMMN
jgi:FkbM family methyltransferase